MWAVVEPLLQPMVCPDTVPIHPVRNSPLNISCDSKREGMSKSADDFAK